MVWTRYVHLYFRRYHFTEHTQVEIIGAEKKHIHKDAHTHTYTNTHTHTLTHMKLTTTAKQFRHFSMCTENLNKIELPMSDKVCLI